MTFYNENSSENQTPSDNIENNSSTPEENAAPEEPRQEYIPDEDDTQCLWSEPKYESTPNEPEEVYSPSRSTYSVSNTDTTEEKPPKKKKSHGFLKAVCLILVCVLLSGTACYFVADYMLDSRDIEWDTPTQVVLGSNSSLPAADSGTSTTASSGGTVTGNQIYKMACDNQVVGVNTSVNTTNIFGQTTSSAVSGTGFVVSTDGYILTNYHVISYAVLYGGELTVMFNDGTSVAAEKIVGYSEDNDVAVIKIDATNLDLNPVTLGDSDSISVGETVYAIGNPLGELTYTMTDGIVSALDRVITTVESSTGLSTSMNMFQISAAVNSGNSGGPVYNSNGEVIGIVTAKYSDSGVEGLGFAIPINDAVSIATQLIEKGYVAGASLGISGSNISDIYSTFVMQYYELPYGVCVMSVNEGSAAENAGLQKGDIITALNGTTVTSMDELKMLLRSQSPGDEGTLTVYRLSSVLGSGEYLELPIVFDETANTTASTGSADSGTSQSQQSGGQDSGSSTNPYGIFPWGSWGSSGR